MVELRFDKKYEIKNSYLLIAAVLIIGLFLYGTGVFNEYFGVYPGDWQCAPSWIVGPEDANKFVGSFRAPTSFPISCAGATCITGKAYGRQWAYCEEHSVERKTKGDDCGGTETYCRGDQKCSCRYNEDYWNQRWAESCKICEHGCSNGRCNDAPGPTCDYDPPCDVTNKQECISSNAYASFVRETACEGGCTEWQQLSVIDCPSGQLCQSGGCVFSDSDGDGVPDDQDECPHEVGEYDLNGCPRMCFTDADCIKEGYTGICRGTGCDYEATKIWIYEDGRCVQKDYMTTYTETFDTLAKCNEKYASSPEEAGVFIFIIIVIIIVIIVAVWAVTRRPRSWRRR